MSLRKKVVKQQSRLAALNLLGTPAGSEAELSDSSTASTDSNIPQSEEAHIEEDLRHCVDDLGEKRATSRESALTNLSKLLSHFYCGFFFDRQSESLEALLQLLLRSVRKPASSQEAVLATKAIALVFINSGDVSESESEALYAMVLPYLKASVVDSPHVDLKCQSIHTLAMVSFAAASHADTKGGLDYFYKILISNASNITDKDEPLSSNDVQLVLESTLSAYGLLYASVYGQRSFISDAWDEWQAVMPAHLELLEAKSKDVRVAAGENVALMYECSHSSKKSPEDEDQEDMSEYEELDDLIDILTRLANESSRRVNKQDRKEQKSAFRDILKSVQEGEKPREKLKLGRQRFMFVGWTQIVELHAFRAFLGPGLSNHFDRNELVQSVFSSGMEESSEEEEIYSGGTGDDSDDDAASESSYRSAKQTNRSKHYKKYKDAYY